LWQWLSRIARAEASEVGLAAVASAFPKFDAALSPVGGRTSSVRLAGSTGSPDVHMPEEWSCPALTFRTTPVRADDSALLHVLEAYIETLKAENEILKRQLAAAEAQAAREAAKAEWAVAEFSALTRRLNARAAECARR
jgi:hypothetical protein